MSNAWILTLLAAWIFWPWAVLAIFWPSLMKDR